MPRRRSALPVMQGILEMREASFLAATCLRDRWHVRYGQGASAVL